MLAALALSLSAASSAAARPDYPIEAPTPGKSRIESTGAPGAAADQRTCRARFNENVNHRRLAETGSPILEVIPAGTWVPVSCERGAGGQYQACGLSSNYWMDVYWNGAWGYSAWSCVKDWEYTSLPPIADTNEGRNAPQRLPALRMSTSLTELDPRDHRVRKRRAPPCPRRVTPRGLSVQAVSRSTFPMIRCPCAPAEVRIDSGWNCTPNQRFAGASIAMTTSSIAAVTRKSPLTWSGVAYSE
jgi:hypothetical protein